MSMLLTLLAPVLTAAAEGAPTVEAASPVFGAPAPAPAALEPSAVQDETTESAAAWTGSVTIGATLTSGNTETRSAAATAEATLDRAHDRINFAGYWNYAEFTDFTVAGGGETKLSQRSWGVSGQYDYFLTESHDTYGYASVSFQGDELANLDLRTIYGVGLGHQFLDDEDLAFTGEIGLSRVEESFKDPADDTENLTIRIAYDLFWRISESTSFRQLAEAFPSLENGDDFYGRLDTSVTVNLTESMIGKLQHVLDYDNTPATITGDHINAGQRADRMDHRLILTVGWTF